MLRLGGCLALALVLLGACAKRPLTTPQAGGPASLTAESRDTSASPRSTDRELADELRLPDVDRPVAAPTGPPDSGLAPAATPQPPLEAPPRVRETPRGIVLTLPEAYFAYRSAELEPRARLAVERIARVLSHPGARTRRIILEGHADDIGTTGYNLTLSRRRAETVARELIARGIRRDRVTVAAFGETRPAAPNRHADGSDNPDGRARNRRVEAVIRS